jgi:hypothetical protein
MATASQTGCSATGSFDLDHGLNDVEGSEHPRQEGEEEYAIAEDDDGISPDDAPELVGEDLNEEVWDLAARDAVQDLTQVNYDFRTSRVRPT